MLLSLVEEELHDIRGGRKGKGVGVLRSSGVAVYSGTKAILLQTLGEVLQSFLSDAMENLKRLAAHRHTLVCKGAV